MISTLPEHVRVLMQELEKFGKEHDALEKVHELKMRNLAPESGEFILILIRAARAKRVLELGTSNGYSTLWLASAVQPLNGRVTTLDKDSRKTVMAQSNFERAMLRPSIDLQRVDAGEFLKRQPDASFDFIFLDTNRESYVSWWPDLRRVLAAGGLMVADNATSHPDEIAPFRQTVEATPGYSTSLAPVGKGELIILKEY